MAYLGPAQPGRVPEVATSTLQEEVEFFVSCRGLANLDIMSKSDPFVVFFAKSGSGWAQVDLSETIKDNLSPTFQKQFKFMYRFEEMQHIRFAVYDRDSSSNDLRKHDLIGYIDTTVSSIMGKPGATFAGRLFNPKHPSRNNGSIVIRGSHVKGARHLVKLSLAGKKLDKKDLFGKSDPYVVVKRVMPDGTPIKVWESKVMKSTLDPVWGEVQLPMQLLCNGDMGATVLFECLDWNRSGDPDYIGTASIIMNSLLASEGREIPFINAKKQAKKKKYKNSGTLVFRKVELIKRPQLLDFVRGGCRINLIAAIDFTASNGAPSTPASLHHMRPGYFNDYQNAIHSVGSILQDYDTDKMIPVYGFGGCINGRVNHCFPLTFDPSSPEVYGVNGVLEAYQNAFQFVSLSGPTYFAPLINSVASSLERCTQDNQSYSVLLILTDGVINDMSETVDAIVRASTLPLSIVIVGVGKADFRAMEVLDADDTPLTSRGRRMARDIVQFVPFRDLRGDGALLARETLAEIPNQLISFMQQQRIQPSEATYVEEGKALEAELAASSATTGTAPPPAGAMPPSRPPPPAGGGGGGAYSGSSQPPMAAPYYPPPASGPYTGGQGAYPGPPGGGYWSTVQSKMPPVVKAVQAFTPRDSGGGYPPPYGGPPSGGYGAGQAYSSAPPTYTGGSPPPPPPPYYGGSAVSPPPP